MELNDFEPNIIILEGLMTIRERYAIGEYIYPIVIFYAAKKNTRFGLYTVIFQNFYF